MAKGRDRFTTYLSPELAARARGAVEGLRAQGITVTLSDISEEAFERYVRHLEETYNDGEPWRNPGRMVGGRPAKKDH